MAIDLINTDLKKHNMAQFPLIDQASLAMIPGAYKESKVYSQLPTDGSGDFTFTRATDNATRVGPTGLIEKGRENLLVRSNEFDTTWVNANTAETSGQSGYNGSSDAWLVTKSAANGMIYQDISASGVQTLSVYAKAGTSTWLRLVANTSAFQGGYFDLSNGVTGGVENAVDTEIEDIGSGWYRCSVILNGSTTRVRIYPAEANSSAATTGSIYIQDAQLEIGLAATDYIESGATTGKAGLLENEPRLDYSGGATCPSLLLEPSRTNLVPFSEYWKGYFTIDTDVTISVNVATSPEGVQNAGRLKYDLASRSMYKSAMGLTGEHSVSFWVKGDGSNIGKTFNLRLQGTSIDQNIPITLTSDWVRVEAQTNGLNILELNNRNSTTIDTGSLLLYGFQIEQGSYPTSYIPNHSGTGSVTRSRDQADNSSLNPILGNGNISVMYDFIYDVVGREGSGQIFLLYSGNNSLGIKGTQPTDRRLQLFSYGDFSGTIGFNEDVPYQTRHKVVFRVTGEVVELFYNGVKQNNTIDASALGGVYNWSRIKLDPTNAILAGLNQLAVFPTALTDSECIKLTTL